MPTHLWSVGEVSQHIGPKSVIVSFTLLNGRYGDRDCRVLGVPLLCAFFRIYPTLGGLAEYLVEVWVGCGPTGNHLGHFLYTIRCSEMQTPDEQFGT